jgi:hypothetical protein
MIQAVLDDKEVNEENSPLDLELFDDDMSNMFKVCSLIISLWVERVRGYSKGIKMWNELKGFFLLIKN